MQSLEIITGKFHIKKKKKMTCYCFYIANQIKIKDVGNAFVFSILPCDNDKDNAKEEDHDS